jgi:hypothetical protein
MSYNFNVNDNFYDESQNSNQQQQYYNNENPFSNSNLNFGSLPNANAASVTTASVVSSNQYYNPNGFYSSQIGAQSQTNSQSINYFTDWTQPSGQFFNPGDKSDPFSSQPHNFGGNSATATNSVTNDFENEPPLLEELGINFDHIFTKTKCVLNPFGKPDASIIHDEDLAGPLVFCIAYGFSLLLMGKVQFGKFLN